ncbi:MAG: hypothetical protein U0163_12230 [Gemmatimonadaceae bacterium]
MKDVVDAQASGDTKHTWRCAPLAYMQMIADPLTDAITKQFPGKFAN